MQLLFRRERPVDLLGGEKGDLYSYHPNKPHRSFTHLFYTLRNKLAFSYKESLTMYRLTADTERRMLRSHYRKLLFQALAGCRLSGDMAVGKRVGSWEWVLAPVVSSNWHAGLLRIFNGGILRETAGLTENSTTSNSPLPSPPLFVNTRGLITTFPQLTTHRLYVGSRGPPQSQPVLIHSSVFPDLWTSP